MTWQQSYPPFGSMVVSTLLAALPVVVMVVGLGPLHLRAHIAAGSGLLPRSSFGVALTGSDTASNVLFGGMQRVAAARLGLGPHPMGPPTAPAA